MAAAFTYQKASAIIMGHPTTLYTTLALHVLLTSPAIVITNAQKTRYDIIHSAPELTIRRCQTANRADRMVTPLEGVPHDCHVASNKYLKARQDLENQPLSHSTLTFFVDGSCFSGTDTNVAGNAIVAPCPDILFFVIVQALPVSQPCSAQVAELKALTAACKLANGKFCTIFTDSASAYGVCHLYSSILAQRGFHRADDSSPVTHGQAISELLLALTLTFKLAIVKCAVHRSDGMFITKGNSAADEAAKQTALHHTHIMPVLVPEDMPPPETNLASLVEM